MKICPICDQKIIGNWCNSCHRFVTPWDIGDNIHMNESHSRTHDADCDYHKPVPGTQYYWKSKQQSKQQPKQQSKRMKKSMSAFIIIYLIIIFGMIGVAESWQENQTSTSIKQQLSEWFSSAFGEDEDSGSHQNTSNQNSSNHQESVEIEPDSEHDYLLQFTPSDSETLAWGTVMVYYDAKDIHTLNQNCDYSHMSITADELLEQILPDVTGTNLQIANDFSEENMNYLMCNDYGQSTYFGTIDELTCDEYYLDIDSDTVTGQIHEISISTFDYKKNKDVCDNMIFAVLHHLSAGDVPDMDSLQQLLSNPGEYINQPFGNQMIMSIYIEEDRLDIYIYSE